MLRGTCNRSWTSRTGLMPDCEFTWKSCGTHQSRPALIAVAIACRSYHFKTYRQCFVGNTAVQWLLSAGFADDAAEAVQMGNDMMSLGLLHHVKHEHAFENRLGHEIADLIVLHQALCCCQPGCLAAGTSTTGGPA